MRKAVELLWDATSGWLPMPEASVEVGPWVFYPLFGLLVAAGVWKTTSEMRESYRAAQASGHGPLHLWVSIIMFVVIGAIGLWFIRS